MSRRTVLLIGHTGFMGRALQQRLETADCHVLGFSRSQGGDIADPDALAHMANEPVDLVYHLGGITGVAASWDDPALFYRVNTFGTQRVLEFCRHKHCALVYVSTYVYGNPVRLPIDEEHPVHPSTPYAHSKYLGEELCRFYQQHYGVWINILRPFNIYGPGQKISFVIPHLIQEIMEKESIHVRSVLPRRDFLYVDDAIDAMMLFLESSTQQIYNLGSGVSYSIYELIQMLQYLIGSHKNVIQSNFHVQNEVLEVVSDCNRLHRTFGWRPRYGLEEGLRRTFSRYSR